MKNDTLKRNYQKMKKEKEFVISYWAECNLELKVKAKNKAEVKKKFFNGDVDWDKVKIIEDNYIDDSLEIE